MDEERPGDPEINYDLVGTNPHINAEISDEEQQEWIKVASKVREQSRAILSHDKDGSLWSWLLKSISDHYIKQEYGAGTPKDQKEQITRATRAYLQGNIVLYHAAVGSSPAGQASDNWFGTQEFKALDLPDKYIQQLMVLAAESLEAGLRPDQLADPKSAQEAAKVVESEQLPPLTDEERAKAKEFYDFYQEGTQFIRSHDEAISCVKKAAEMIARGLATSEVEKGITKSEDEVARADAIYKEFYKYQLFHALFGSNRVGGAGGAAEIARGNYLGDHLNDPLDSEDKVIKKIFKMAKILLRTKILEEKQKPTG